MQNSVRRSHRREGGFVPSNFKKPFIEPTVDSEKMYEVSQACDKCQTVADITGVGCDAGIDKS